MLDLHQVYQILIPRLQASDALAKTASTKALFDKAATDYYTLGLLKQAGMGPLGKGLMYGAGAAIPATAAGAFLINRAGNESRKTVEDVRNKALQAAAGIATIGGGLYAMHRATKPTTKTTTGYARDQSGEMVPVRQLESKVSSAQENPQVVLEKLATVAFLDVIFENQRDNGPESERTKVAECLMLNAEHAVDLLRQLLV